MPIARRERVHHTGASNRTVGWKPINAATEANKFEGSMATDFD